VRARWRQSRELVTRHGTWWRTVSKWCVINRDVMRNASIWFVAHDLLAVDIGASIGASAGAAVVAQIQVPPRLWSSSPVSRLRSPRPSFAACAVVRV